MAKTTVRGAQIADGANGVDLTVDVTGTLPVANGGTNAITAIGARANLGAAASARVINTSSPLSGGGDLTADRTLSISAANGSDPGTMSAADFTKLSGITSGTWTPTLAGVANVSSSSAQTCHYIRVGSEVSFAGTLTVGPTATATNTQISITVPIASTLGSVLNDAHGTATTQQAVGGGGAFVRADGAGKLLLQFTASGTGNVTFRFSGIYIIN